MADVDASGRLKLASNPDLKRISFPDFDSKDSSTNPFYDDSETNVDSISNKSIEHVEDWPGHRYLPALMHFDFILSGKVPLALAPSLICILRETKALLEKERAELQKQYEAENAKINKEYQAGAREIRPWGGLQNGYLWMSKMVGYEDETAAKKQEEDKARLAILNSECCERFYTMRAWVYDKKLYTERAILQDFQRGEMTGLLEYEISEAEAMKQRQQTETRRTERKINGIKGAWLAWDREEDERRCVEMSNEMKKRHIQENLDLGLQQGLRREGIANFHHQQMELLETFYNQQKERKINATA